jgi:membrane protein DedA with SNARE-associated domain
MFRQFVLHFVSKYSYLGIFSLLTLGIVGLPVPDEFLLTFVGYLIFRGRLHLAPAAASAFLGSVCGITLSYWLGRTLGIYLVNRYGTHIGLGPKQVQRVHDWFARIGGWSLTFGYYVPGLRHLTAYVAGTAGFELPQFAIFAYAGAAVWSASFLALGYYLGDGWHAATQTVRDTTRVVVWLLIIAAVVWGLLQRARNQKS